MSETLEDTTTVRYAPARWVPKHGKEEKWLWVCHKDHALQSGAEVEVDQLNKLYNFVPEDSYFVVKIVQIKTIERVG